MKRCALFVLVTAAFCVAAGDTAAQSNIPPAPPPAAAYDQTPAITPALVPAGHMYAAPASAVQLAPPRAVAPQAPPPVAPLPVPNALPQAVPAGELDARIKAQVDRLVTERLNEEKEKQKKADEKKKAEEKAKAELEKQQGYVVGSKLNNWSNSWRNGLWFDSPNKDFSLHIGGTAQYDLGLYSPQSNLVTGPHSIGITEDGVNLRRGRFRAEGSMWENIDFLFELEFFNAITPAGSSAIGVSRAGEGQTVHTTSPTDAGFTIKKLPWIGNFRVGNMKEPIGLEHLESYRFLPFMERSPLFDFNTPTAFNNGFNPGMMIFDTMFDERGTWWLGVFKNIYNVGGFAVVDGDYAITGRMTALPWYEMDGRYLMHVAVAGSHRDPEFGENRYRIRPSIRSAPGPLTTLIPILTDTGFFSTTSQDIFSLEYFVNLGPLSFQAEYMSFWNANTTTKALGNVGTTFYQGYYIQALYWLTGEYTQWSKKAAAPTRYIVNNPFFLIPGANGWCRGTGAWQAGVRWSQVDGNNRGVNGGMLDDVTFGLTWVLNPNIKFQWNYELARRYGLSPASNGNFNAFGMRAQVDF